MRQAEARPFHVDGEPVELAWVRDRSARRLRLTVSERGVRLSIPWRVPEAVATAFLHDHHSWIAEQWLRHRSVAVPIEWAFGAVHSLPLLGTERPLRWTHARSSRLELDPDSADGLCFFAPQAASAPALRRALREFYAAQARTAVARWLPAYLPGLPRPPASFRFRALSSLWGSLSPDAAVSLDLTLVLGPPAAFEYVLVHELCHLLQRNHSPAFWAEVEHRFPTWREQRTFLRGPEGLGLKAGWRALVG